MPSRLLAIILFSAPFAVNLQAPLYPAYAALNQTGSAGMSIAFAAYVVGLLPTLLFLNSLSDRYGRQFPIAFALLLNIGATLLLTYAPSWESLVIARFLLGISMGLITPAGAAYMRDILKNAPVQKAAFYVTMASALGFGSGALATSLSLAFEGMTFTPSSFFISMSLAGLLSMLVFTLPKAHQSQTIDHAVNMTLPLLRLSDRKFHMGLAIAWSATGLTISLLSISMNMQGLGSWSGLVIFLSCFSGFLCQPFARKQPLSRSLNLGLIASPLGFFFLISGLYLDLLPFLCIGAAITSIASYGLTYYAGFTKISQCPPAQQARSVAGLFTSAYIGFAIPVILCGLMAEVIGMTPAIIIFFIYLCIACYCTYKWG